MQHDKRAHLLRTGHCCQAAEVNLPFGYAHKGAVDLRAHLRAEIMNHERKGPDDSEEKPLGAVREGLGFAS